MALLIFCYQVRKEEERRGGGEKEMGNVFCKIYVNFVISILF
jgi:hypothetical protein